MRNGRSYRQALAYKTDPQQAEADAAQVERLLALAERNEAQAVRLRSLGQDASAARYEETATYQRERAEGLKA